MVSWQEELMAAFAFPPLSIKWHLKVIQDHAAAFSPLSFGCWKIVGKSFCCRKTVV